MSYLYIDESGDLGFGKNGTDYFIITCVKIDNEKVHQDFSRITKKVRQNKLPKRYKQLVELKFSNSREDIRRDFLKRVTKLDLEIYSIIIKKDKTYANLQKKLPILYNYLIKVLLENPLRNIKSNLHLMICLDRAMSLTQRNNFEGYIQTEFFTIFQKLPKVEIKHESSQQNECLQVIDFICGAFGYKYNTMKLKNNAGIYTNIINPKIIMEKTDLFK